MRKLKLIYLLLLLPFGANAQWIGGATTQGIFSGNKQIRWNFGTSGFVYGYTKGQIDSLFSTVTGSVSSVFGRIGAITAQAGDYAAFYAPIGSGAGYIPYSGATTTFNRNQQDITGSFTGAGITHSDLLSTGSWAQNVHDLTSTYSLSSDFQPQRTMHSNVPNGVLANTVYTSFGLDNAFTSAQIESNIPFKFKTPFVGLIAARGTYGALEYLPKQRIDSLLTPKITLASLSANSPLIYNNLNGTFSIQLAGSSQSGYLSSTDWNIFNNKESAITAGTTLQYWRGDKTFQTLNTAAVPELTNLYYTNTRGIGSTLTGYVSGAGTVSSSDNILQAIQKLNGNIGALVTGVSSFNTRTGAVTLNSGDVTTALGFTPENVANKTATQSSSTTTYPNWLGVTNYVSGLGTTYLLKSDSGNVANNYVTYGKYISGATTQYNKTFVAPVLGTPLSATLTNATGLPISTGVSGLGTGVAGALGNNIGSSGSLVLLDANLNTNVNNFIGGFATTVTAATTTTLTATSAYQQYFTGTTTQTVILPVVSTLVLGMQYAIVNNSTGVVTVTSSGGNTVATLPVGSDVVVTCRLTTGTTAASWNSSITYIAASATSNGIITTGSQTIAGAKSFNNPIVINYTGTATSPQQFSILAPNLLTGNHTYSLIGTAVSTNNAAEMGFYNIGGAGSASNYGYLSMYSATPMFYYNSAAVSIGGANFSKLFQVGTTGAFNSDASGNVVATTFTKTGGTSSQFLMADGSVNSSTYALSSSTSISVQSYRAITASTTILATDYTINVTSGTFSQALPTTTLATGQIINIKNSGVGTVTVTGTSVDGSASIPLSSGSGVTLQYTGTSGTYIIL